MSTEKKLLSGMMMLPRHIEKLDRLRKQAGKSRGVFFADLLDKIKEAKTNNED